MLLLRARSRLALLLGAVTVVWVNGCSFAVVRPAPGRADWPNPVTAHSSQYRCTRSLAPPALDTAAVGIGGTVAYLGHNHDSLGGVFTPVVLVATLPFLVSAVYGYAVVERCRDYQSIFATEPPP
jgi:hypothetical protein